MRRHAVFEAFNRQAARRELLTEARAARLAEILGDFPGDKFAALQTLVAEMFDGAADEARHKRTTRTKPRIFINVRQTHDTSRASGPVEIVR